MFVVKKDNQKVPVKIWRDSITDMEGDCYTQAEDVSNHPAIFHHVALMPDCHVGYGLPIGGVAALDGCISPYMIGSDISCGCLAVKTSLKAEKIPKDNLKKIIDQIKRDIPMGTNWNRDNRTSEKFQNKFKDIKKLYDGIKPNFKKILDLKFPDCAEDACGDWEERALEPIVQQLGSLGSGNHFIELQKDQDGFLWIMIHSGSRNLGKRICDYFHKIALEKCKMWKIDLPNPRVAYLPVDDSDAQHYLKDMNFCMQFSYLNRLEMLENIKYAIKRNTKGKIEYFDVINIHHNYAALENHFGKNVWVHRKGATSAKKNQLGIIPGSMGTSSYIVKGRGNKESFMSCSHGAGRKMGRRQAKEAFNIDIFRKKMKGIVSNDVNNDHLDESPMAYKNIDKVIELQKDLIDVEYVLTPIANCKG